MTEPRIVGQCDPRLLLLSDLDNVVIACVTLATGDVVHLHNMKSDYLPTYVHEGGIGYTKR